jgi:hypothetical protein
LLKNSTVLASRQNSKSKEEWVLVSDQLVVCLNDQIHLNNLLTYLTSEKEQKGVAVRRKKGQKIGVIYKFGLFMQPSPR